MPRGPKPNLEHRQQAIRLHAEGLSPAEIGRRMGITAQGIHSLLQRAGVNPGRVVCRACKAVISNRRHQGQRSRAVLCRQCLAKQTETTFAERLRSLRNAAGLTQVELARKAKVPTGTIATYEVGHSRPRPKTLARLVRVLGKQLLQGEQ